MQHDAIQAIRPTSSDQAGQRKRWTGAGYLAVHRRRCKPEEGTCRGGAGIESEYALEHLTARHKRIADILRW